MGLGRMIRLTHDQGPVVLTVVRFCIAGRFATGDFFKAGKLARRLSAAAGGPAVGPYGPT